MASTQLYRQSKLGDCLVEALIDLINARKLNPDLAIRVLSEYDLVRGRSLASGYHPRPCHMLLLATDMSSLRPPAVCLLSSNEPAFRIVVHCTCTLLFPELGLLRTNISTCNIFMALHDRQDIGQEQCMRGCPARNFASARAPCQ